MKLWIRPDLIKEALKIIKSNQENLFRCLNRRKLDKNLKRLLEK